MMKKVKIIFACFTLFCSIVLLSFSTFLSKTGADFLFLSQNNTEVEITDIYENSNIEPDDSGDLVNTPYDADLNITIYNYQEKRYEDISLRDYLICAVAGEMPVTFESEALKAQAIAARTYVMARHSIYSNANCKTYTDANVCTNSTCCQAYKSIDKMVSSWGEKYDEYFRLYENAVDSTDGKIITYNNKPISVFYFSTSNGYTEACEDVFVATLPYYTSVKSENEENAPRYYNSKRIEMSTFVDGLKELSNDKTITNNNVTQKIKIISYTAGGRVNEIQIGNNVVKGTAFRSAFSLNSADFNIIYNDDHVIIETYGWGHGVGMSQNGANQMAKNGSDCIEILYHYYVNTLVQRAK